MNEEQVYEIKEFAVQTLPEYRRPLVEKLITSGIFDRDLEGYDSLACEILDDIVTNHTLDAHLRANLQPESHD